MRAVVVTGGLDKVFCAGANIQMLAGSTHAHKVNFCKFTNETRNAIEDATAHSGQVWIAAVNGTAAGGGYELALACDEIVLVDDRSSAVSLPEVPLLAVLPGTGGLTRVVDKRHVRRDLADVFATRAEGVKGQQALDWGLVDAIAPRSRFDEVVRERALARAAGSHRPDRRRRASRCTPLDAEVDADALRYAHVDVAIDRALGAAHITVPRPDAATPSTTPDDCSTPTAWIVAAARELDDAILRLRFNEPEVGTWVLHTAGDAGRGRSPPRTCCAAHADHWLVNEVAPALDPHAQAPRPLGPHARRARRAGQLLRRHARRARRSPPTARSCSTGPTRTATRRRPTLRLTDANDGWFPMSNGLSRLATRFWGRDDALRRGPRRRSARTCSPPTPPTPGSSRSRPTTSTGTTRCG